MTHASKDRTNPHFGSKYADLASIMDAIREPLSSNGLAVAQLVTSNADGVTCTTRLLHSSGESIEAACWLPVVQKTPQSYGSTITYARRYSLAALVGVASEDDDGNAGSGVGKGVTPPPAGIDKLREQAVGSKPMVAHEDLVMASFGPGAGKKLSQLDNDGVLFYRGACVKTLGDASKAQYHARETLRLAAFDAELRHRNLTA